MGNFRTSQAISLQVDPLDAKFRHRFTNSQCKRVGGGLRSDIREFSRQSRSRLIYSARNVPGLKCMITLTFPHEDYALTSKAGNFMTDGKLIKEQLRRVRQWLTYRDIYGFWFLEFQTRGAPHFHIVTSSELSERDVNKLKLLWHKLVGSDCPHHKTIGVKYEILRKKDSAAAYASKYSGKSEQKTVPASYSSVGRFWGLFGRVPDDRLAISILNPRELYDLARVARRWCKADARSRGYKLRPIPGQGITGHSFYNSGAVLRAYLSRLYTLPDNLQQIFLVARPSGNFAC